MKKIIPLAAALLVWGVTAAGAADYVVIKMEKAVDRPPAAVWAKIGPYCAIADWLKVACVYTSGTGDVGTMRRLNNMTDEVMTGKTAYSYTYTQPTTPILYHGILDVEPVDGGKRSNIVYTLFYDAASLATPEAKAADRDRREKRFTAALDVMKAMAEAPVGMTKDVDILTICQLLRPDEEQEIAGRYNLVRADKDAVPDDVAQKARGLITSGLDGAPAALIARMPRLEIITVNSVGYDLVDVPLATARGIPVTHTPDVLTDDVADLAMGLIIMASRRLGQAERFVRDGHWGNQKFPVAGKVTGKTLGILGMGRIGRAIAARAEGFAMDIVYTDRMQLDTPYRFVPDLMTLAHESDFLMIAASAGPQSRHLVDAAVLEALGPHGILINIARGSLVDEKALIAALEAGKVGGAGLDVFEHEPKVPDALRTRDDVVLLPHIASSTRETRSAMGRLVIQNLDAWFAHQPLVTPVPESRSILPVH